MLIRSSRARRKRDRAEARLLRAQTVQVREENRVALQTRADASAGKPLWQQPTLGALVAEIGRRREAARVGDIVR